MVMYASRLTLAMLITIPIAFPASCVTTDTSVYCGTRQWRFLIEEAAEQSQVPPAWPEAILHAESAGCAYTNGIPTVSSAGAMGLMQLMPETWEKMKFQLHLGEDPFDPHDNILASVAYLRDLYDQFGLEGAIASYHSGPSRYLEHLRTGQALPISTLDYVSRVLTLINVESVSSPLFVERGSRTGTLSKSEEAAQIAKLRINSKDEARADHALSRRLFIDLTRTGHLSEAPPPEPAGRSSKSKFNSNRRDAEPQNPEAR
jgi:hypothetical protein